MRQTGADPARREPRQEDLRDGAQPRASPRPTSASPRSAPDIPACCCTARTRWSGSSRPPGPALGLGGTDWPVNELELPAGHGLLLLTDGLFEGHSGAGNERLGEDGLLELARSRADLPGPAFVDALIDGAEERAGMHGGLSDDIAVVRVERTGHDLTHDETPTHEEPLDVRLRSPCRAGRPWCCRSWASWCSAPGSRARCCCNATDEVSHELIDEVQPSRSAAYRLQAALRDQETAIRGYAISADRQFLDPYYDGPGGRGHGGRGHPPARRWPHRTHRRPRRDRTGGCLVAVVVRRATHRKHHARYARRGQRRRHRARQGRIRPHPNSFSMARINISPTPERRVSRTSTRFGPGATGFWAPSWWFCSPRPSLWRS